MKYVPELPPATIAELKKEFEDALMASERQGVDDLLIWLDTETDFFSAPASTQHHGAYVGGLLAHSVKVYKVTQNFLKNISDVPPGSIAIVALLHDLCKCNFYVRRVKNVKVPGEKRWEEEESFGIEDTLPLGHGEKSVFLAMNHIRLTEAEALAIRWHMGGFDDAARSYVGGMTQAQAFRKYPLAVALAIADMYVAYLLDD